MSSQESIMLVLIAALSLAAIYVLIRMFARFRGDARIDGVRVEKRHVGMSWVVSLSSGDLPRGLSVGRPPSPPPHDLTSIREGLAAWGLSARRRFKDESALKQAWAAADGEWTLSDGTLQSWVRDARGLNVAKRIDARVVEGLALVRLLKGTDAA